MKTPLRHFQSRISLRTVLLAVCGLLAALVVLMPIPDLTQPGERRFDLQLAQYAFTPGRLEVNYGDKVVLNVTSSDVVHGLYLDGYTIDRRIEPGIPQQIEFVATQSGKFHFRCSVSCGAMHPFMIGELVVGSNVPYARAIGLIVIAVAGVFVYLWKRPYPESEVG